jgi:hypothetical protein
MIAISKAIVSKNEPCTTVVFIKLI